jgi:hypothetical protein
VQIGTDRRGRELFEFCILRKNPLRDLHGVSGHPEGLARGHLSRRIARRQSKHSPSEEEPSFCGGRSYRKDQER